MAPTADTRSSMDSNLLVPWGTPLAMVVPRGSSCGLGGAVEVEVGRGEKNKGEERERERAKKKKKKRKEKNSL